jgi:hypothetical protein
MMRRVFALLAALALHGCAVMKPDMTDFTGVQLPEGLQAPGYVPTQVAAFKTLQEVQHWCAKGDKRQQAAAVGGMYLACAIYTNDDRCLVIVWTETAYQLLGHELMHCMWGPRTMAGKTDGVPAHFVVQPTKVQP